MEHWKKKKKHADKEQNDIVKITALTTFSSYLRLEIFISIFHLTEDIDLVYYNSATHVELSFHFFTYKQKSYVSVCPQIPIILTPQFPRIDKIN